MSLLLDKPAVKAHVSEELKQLQVLLDEPPPKPKLSLLQAVLEGVKKTDFLEGWWSRGVDRLTPKPVVGQACVLGAALYGSGLTPDDMDELMIHEDDPDGPGPLNAVFDHWPELRDKPDPCPDCDERMENIAAMAIHLNDSHGWKREDTAVWVDRVLASRRGGSADGVSPS